MPKALVNGININYRVQGKGEPLVLIMGADIDQSGWMCQTRAFKKYFRVVTFDNRGVGKSDKPSWGYSIKTMADDTIGLMDYLGINKAHILGVSMGGAIAQVIAINYPERVNKLILGSTYAKYATNDESSGCTQELLKAYGMEESLSNDAWRSMPIHKLAVIGPSFAFNGKVLRTILPLFIYIRFRLMPTRDFIVHSEVPIGHNTVDNLHKINVPTLVITGTKDRSVKPSSSDVIAKLIPNAKLVKVEGGSHALNFEMRGRFNKEVLDFLRFG